MKRHILLCLMLIIQACATTPGINTARKVELSDPFTENLRRGYIDLADHEWKNGNKEISKAYGKKAMMVVQNKRPQPENFTGKIIDPDQLQYLKEARKFILTVMDKNMQSSLPLAVANMQLMFDCWAFQEDKKIERTQDSDACVKGYQEAEVEVMQAYKALLQREYEEQQAAIRHEYEERMQEIAQQNQKDLEVAENFSSKTRPEPYEIFFKFNKKELDTAGYRVLDKVAREVPIFQPRKIVIGGNTDLSGTDEYNRNLAMERAEVVSGYLIDKGVSPDLLDIRSYGKSAAEIEGSATRKDERYRSVQVIFLYDNKVYYEEDF